MSTAAESASKLRLVFAVGHCAVCAGALCGAVWGHVRAPSTRDALARSGVYDDGPLGGGGGGGGGGGADVDGTPTNASLTSLDRFLSKSRNASCADLAAAAAGEQQQDGDMNTLSTVLGSRVWNATVRLLEAGERDDGSAAALPAPLVLHCLGHVRAAARHLRRLALKRHSAARLPSRRSKRSASHSEDTAALLRCANTAEELESRVQAIARSAILVTITAKLGSFDPSITPHHSVKAGFAELTRAADARGGNGRNVLEDLPGADELLDALKVRKLRSRVAGFFDSHATNGIGFAIPAGGGLAAGDSSSSKPPSAAPSPTVASPIAVPSFDGPEALNKYDAEDLYPVLWADADDDGFHAFLVSAMKLTIRNKSRRNIGYFGRHLASAAFASSSSAAVSAVAAFCTGRLETGGALMRAVIEEQLLGQHTGSAAAGGVLKATSPRRAEAVQYIIASARRVIGSVTFRGDAASAALIPDLTVLIGVEVARAALLSCLRDVLQRGMASMASASREKTKARVHYALTRVPLGLYDTVDPELMENILNYPNDLEGVDVQLANVIAQTLQLAWSAFATITLVRRWTVVGGFAAAALGTHLIVRQGRKAVSALQRQRNDLEELETARSARVIADTFGRGGIQQQQHATTSQPADMMMPVPQPGSNFSRAMSSSTASFAGSMTSAPSRADLGNGSVAAAATTPTTLAAGPRRTDDCDWLATDSNIIRAMGTAQRSASSGVLIRPADLLEHVFALRAAGGVDAEQVVRWHRGVRLVAEAQTPRGWRDAVRRAVAYTAAPTVAAVISCFKFLAPLVAVGIVNAQLRAVGEEPVPASTAVELQRSIVGVMDVVEAARRVCELVSLNAHKAHTLAALCDPRIWEHRADSMPVEQRLWLAQSTINCVTVQDVRFAPPARPDVSIFSGLSMQFPLPDGSIVAIVGPSGSGKTTLLNLLVRLYEPQAGSVCVVADDDDASSRQRGQSRSAHMDTRDIDLPILRRHFFAYVPQDPPIFDDCTVSENITMDVDGADDGGGSSSGSPAANNGSSSAAGSPGSPRNGPTLGSPMSHHHSAGLSSVDAKIARCAEVAQCDGFIRDWPERYMTTLGAHRVRPSGGQRRRLGIARGLYRDAQVLLLDEPSAGLDGTTSLALLRRLRAHARDAATATRCIVVVTHDRDWIDAADVVVPMPTTGCPQVGRVPSDVDMVSSEASATSSSA